MGILCNKKVDTGNGTHSVYAQIVLLFDYAKLLANLGEGCNGFVQVLFLVACRDLYTDTCLVFWYYRVVEANYVDSLVQKFLSHLL